MKEPVPESKARAWVGPTFWVLLRRNDVVAVRDPGQKRWTVYDPDLRWVRYAPAEKKRRVK